MKYRSIENVELRHHLICWKVVLINKSHSISTWWGSLIVTNQQSFSTSEKMGSEYWLLSAVLLLPRLCSLGLFLTKLPFQKLHLKKLISFNQPWQFRAGNVFSFWDCVCHFEYFVRSTSELCTSVCLSVCGSILLASVSKLLQDKTYKNFTGFQLSQV